MLLAFKQLCLPASGRPVVIVGLVKLHVSLETEAFLLRTHVLLPKLVPDCFFILFVARRLQLEFVELQELQFVVYWKLFWMLVLEFDNFLF